MLSKLIRFSLENKTLVVFVSLALVAFTFYQLPRMPVDVFPELNAPQVVIMTEAPGFAPEDVEQYITFPVESVMTGLPGVRRVRSSSALSLSMVWVEFDWGQDIYRARQLVSERLVNLESELPKQAHPEVSPMTSITGEIMLISLSLPDGQGDELELRAYAEFELRKQLLAIPGIAQVVAIGGELPEYQVNVDPEKLLLHDLTFEDLRLAIEAAHSTESGGMILNYQGQELPIRQQAQVKSLDDIRETLVRNDEQGKLQLGEVADVRFGGALKRGSGSEGGHGAVIIGVKKLPGTNTLELTKAVDQVLDEAQRSLPEGSALNRHVMRQAEFIQRSVDNLLLILRDAILIVAFILALFLLNIRTTFITLTAIPLSLGISLLVLWLFDLSINVMTLGGLALAIGELVDDAIIDVENVFRRLRENNNLPLPEQKSSFRIVLDASNEVRSSVVFATVIIVIVFLPLLFLEGVEGRFFRPLGIAYIVSILASLFVALTLTPVLCKLLLSKKSKVRKKDQAHIKKLEREGFFIRLLQKLYQPLLSWALKLRWLLLVFTLLLTLAALSLASTFGTSFLPEFNEGTLTVFLIAPPGTSLAESDRMANAVEKQLIEIPGVASVVRRTGRAEKDQHAEPVGNSEVEVRLEADASKVEVRSRIDAVLQGIPGITTMIGQPIEHRLSHILSGTPAAIAMNVYGEDLDTLRKIAKEIETALKSTPGLRDINANREALAPSLPVTYKPQELARWGLRPAEAAQQVKTAFLGDVIHNVNDGVRQYQVVLRLQPEARKNPEQLRNFLLRGKEGNLVRLHEVARVGKEEIPSYILRENTKRKSTISCNIEEGFNLGHAIQAVRERVTPILKKYEGYTISYGGQFEAQQSASRIIIVFGIGALLIIFLLLTSALKSLKAAALIMINLPLALIGGIAALFLAASEDPFGNLSSFLGFSTQEYIAPVLSITGMVGFITLFGIAIRNGILLVSRYQVLIQEEKKSVREAIFEGSQERLVPILMTALTAVLGLLPLVLAAGKPGSELLAPLALVVLGGLTTSTFLNLIVVPAGYSILFRAKREKRFLDEQETLVHNDREKDSSL